MSVNHLPLEFAFIFFKAVYRTSERVDAANELVVLFDKVYLRDKICEIMNLLEDIYFNLFEIDYLLPFDKLCPDAWSSDSLNQIEGPPLQDELLRSLCWRTIDESFLKDVSIWGKCHTMDHIWRTPCPLCKLQIVLFKILLGGVRNY